MQPAPKISKTDAYIILESWTIIQLSFCVRWSLKPDWDYEKISLVKSGAGSYSEQWQKRILGYAMVELEKDREAANLAMFKLPPQYHEPVFLACARIVALKGFEEDITRLVDLKDRLAIEDYRAEMLIELARSEAELNSLGAVL